MMEKHIILEAVNPDTASGRKPKIYSIDPNCRNIVVIDLGSSPAKIGIADLSGNLLSYETFSFIDENNPTACINNVIAFVKSLIKKNECDEEQHRCL